jgi:hypothetical protein
MRSCGDVDVIPLLKENKKERGEDHDRNGSVSDNLRKRI